MMITVWIIAIVIFAIIEALTPQFVSIWFAGGAAIALICELLGLSITIQIIVFVISSILLVMITYPILKQYSKNNTVALNADSLIGEEGISEVDINNLNATGQVKIRGQIWSAKSDDGNMIEKGNVVKVIKIEGDRSKWK